MNDYAVFIPSNGRADNVITYKTLRRLGYDGEIFIVIDDEDKTADEYYKLYGDQVIMFSKQDAAKITDTANNFHDMRAVVYARNQIPIIAKEMGYKHFIVLDDDYTSFMFRFVENNKLTSCECKQMDRLFKAVFEFLDKSGAVTVTLAQGGDFIGGKENQFVNKGLARKAMNTWFCSTERYFKFYGQINEDTTTYVLLGGRGDLFFTVTKAMVTQLQTQSNPNGLTTIYLDNGTYVKSFYSVMYCPSCVKVSVMGAKNKRIHHRINWNNAVPNIIEEKYKKGV